MKVHKSCLIITLSMLLLLNCKSLVSIERELANHQIINESTGDLNGDGISDLAVVVTAKSDDKDSVIVFILDSKGKFVKQFVNEYLTYSFMDWYGELPETTIENGQLSVWYYGGMCHRQSRTVLFEFDEKQTNIFFKELVVAEHNVCNNQEPFSETTTNPELRKVSFSHYKDEL